MRLLSAFATALLTASPLIAAPVDFADKIAPLFEEHCVDCHAAQDGDGDLNLETFEGLLKGGKTGKALEAGHAQESLLVKFLEGRSGKEGKNKFMPPGKKEHLQPEEIALIRTWIDGGAPAPALRAKASDVLRTLPKITPKTGRGHAIQALAYSAKANLLAAGSYASVQLLDATTRAPKQTLGGVAGKVNALTFSPDGTMLFAAAGDAGLPGAAYQWKLSDGSLMRKFEGHLDALYALALSPDAQTLATGSYDQKIKLWQIADGREMKTLAGHNGGVFGLSFRPDGKVLASASADRTVKLWEVATGKRLDTFSQPLKEQTAIAFAPDGLTVVAGGMDNRLRVWSVSAGAQEGTNPLVFTRFAHEGAILNLAFLPDGATLASTAADRTVKLWKTSDLTEQRVLEPQPDWAPGLIPIGMTQLALGRLDGSLAFYNTATGAPAPKPAAAAMSTLPVIMRLEPRGVPSGATTKVKVIGQSLAAIQAVKFTSPELSAEVLSINPGGVSAELAITATDKAPRSQVELTIVTPAGESAGKKLSIDNLPQIVAAPAAQSMQLDALPVNIWGTLAATGQRDEYTFAVKKGQMIVLDLAARRIESKAESTRLEVLDAERHLLAANNGLDSGTDPFLAFTAPRDGEFTARVLEVTLEGSPEHAYRLTVGELPFVTGWWPLSVPVNAETEIHLVGPNIVPGKIMSMKTKDVPGESELPLASGYFRLRTTPRVVISDLPEVLEQEPNDTPAQAQAITVPASINGRLLSEGDRADFDLYRFEAEEGQQLVIETRAAMLGSPADTKLEVLNENGDAVPRLLLQATKDSWLALRSADSKAGGIRLGQFSEMDLNDFMYFNGEVLKIFRLARGPDADMGFYTRGGVRRAYFDTSASSHGLDEPCYVVEPRPVGSKIVANGLPVFTLNYTNDDDSERLLGKDSRLLFTAPAQGRYLIRVSDTRGWSGERFAYRLIVRAPAPDFTATLAAKAATPLPSGSGQQIIARVERVDGFEGDVRFDISGAPAGFYISSPIVVQAGHLSAPACVYALAGAKPGPADFSQVKITATGEVNGRPIVKTIAAFSSLTVAAAPPQVVYLEPEQAGHARTEAPAPPPQPFEITVAPGGRIPAWLRVARQGNNALLALNIEGLPHGVIVDSIGLNGIQVREAEIEREIFLACAPWVQEQDRLCHVVIGNAGGGEIAEGLPASFPVLLKVRRSASPTASAK